jgi:hypothetical protein
MRAIFISIVGVGLEAMNERRYIYVQRMFSVLKAHIKRIITETIAFISFTGKYKRGRIVTVYAIILAFITGLTILSLAPKFPCMNTILRARLQGEISMKDVLE